MRSISIVFFLVSTSLQGQNLVPNPSFEEVHQEVRANFCGFYNFQKKVKSWKAPLDSEPILIAKGCNEKYIQAPKSRHGENMIGITTRAVDWTLNNKVVRTDYSSDYIGVELIESLQATKSYSVSFWIRRAPCVDPKKNEDEYMNGFFGICLSEGEMKESHENMLIGIPQVKINPNLLITSDTWQYVETIIAPIHSYSHLTMGQFRENATSKPEIAHGFYVIDDIVIKAIDTKSIFETGKVLAKGLLVPLKHMRFKSGSIEFSDDASSAELDRVVAYLRKNPTSRISIQGHTDSVGDPVANIELSQRRALKIAQIIVDKGIDTSRVESKGYGEHKPIYDNSTKEGRLGNRRVELVVLE